MSAIEGRRCKHCGWFVSKLELDAAKFNIQCARCGPNGYLEPATLPRHGREAVKEPTVGKMIVMTHTGLYATEKDRDRMAARIDDALAATRAEGMREAAGIAAKFARDNYAAKPFTSYIEGRADAASDVKVAILSAIGDSQ